MSCFHTKCVYFYAAEGVAMHTQSLCGSQPKFIPDLETKDYSNNIQQQAYML